MLKRTFSTTIIAAVIFFVPSLLLAAGLGKLTVNSGLGQPLRAEIELLAVEKDELGSLGARLASPDAFQQAGISYSSDLAQLKLAIEKNSRGQPLITVTSAQPFDEAFLDLLVELTWSTGRIVREYTALLDPPDFGIPLVPPVAVVPEKLPASKPAPAASVAASAAPASEGSREYGPVKSGDTLSRIAKAVKPSDVNLEQALVSLYRANQNAFIGNMNRLKSGQILRVPDAAEFANVARTEAIAEVKAQTANWNAYRQKLGLTPVAVANARSAQSASGRISVADAGAEKSESQEVLRISKAETGAAPKAQAAGALQERVRTLEEEILSKEQAVKEANERVAILEKQVGEMKRLVELKGQQPAVPATKPEAPASIADNKSQAPADPSKPAVTEKLAVPAPKEESGSLLDDIMQNPLYLAAIALIVVLAAVFGIRAIRRKREETSGPMVVAQEPSLASEHNQVAEPEVAAQTVITEPGAEDMDPVSEAEVYLAYDREQQAEEILKDGLKKTPARHELRLKLLEIYSRRSDISAFDAIIRQLYNATGGVGPMWERAATMGFALDPDNPLYALAEPVDLNPIEETVEDEPMLEHAPEYEEPASTVLEFDFDAKSEPAGLQTEPVFASDDTLILHERTEESQAIEPELPPEKLIATIDFNTERRHLAAAETDINFEQRVEEPMGEEIVFEKPVLDFTPAEEAYAQDLEEPVMASAGKNGNGQAGDFAFTPAAQLSDIDLNLEDQPAPANGQDEMWQQVEVKFDLARAYQDMGEKEGAREILEEVIKDGDAKQQRAARSMLANL